MRHVYQDQTIGGGDALYAMSDVNINNPEDGQMLVYDAQTERWRNVTQKSLNDLAEVTDLTNIIATGTTNATGGTIPKGTFFYLNDDLCQAKADIASGATFTLNTNYEEVTAGGLNALNSKTLKELWKNTSPTSSFGAQTITLSSNDYDYLILISKNAASSNGALSFMALKGMGFYSQWCNRDGNYPLVAYKFIQYTDDTHFAAPDTTVSAHTSGLSTNNNYLVPIAIYGGKF